MKLNWKVIGVCPRLLGMQSIDGDCVIVPEEKMTALHANSNWAVRWIKDGRWSDERG